MQGLCKTKFTDLALFLQDKFSVHGYNQMDTTRYLQDQAYPSAKLVLTMQDVNKTLRNKIYHLQ